ncbi:MAG TPA: PQQ-binding-like beta-propeller repeat protein [Prosthecobacter sp.]|nr:PQQ-binding-like beta-propeller repeat protein [Prosthecobacter sp.]
MKIRIPLIALLSMARVFAAAETPPPNLPLPVASFGATATSGGDVFIYGGHSGTRHKYNREEVHGDLYHWRSGLSAWEKLSGDEPSQGASLLATAKGVLRIGGMAARNAKGEKQDLWSSETAALFDLTEKKWEALPKLPERRSSHDSVMIGDKVYVIGGWAMTGGKETTWHDTYLTLDLAKPEEGWREHQQPFERRALAVQAVGTKIYAIGGMDSDDEITNAVAVLDTSSGKWSEGPPLPKDKLGGFGFAAVAHEGRLFASGATGKLLELRDTEWVGVAELRHPRFFHRLVAGGKGGIIALGGESKEGKKTPPEVIVLPSAKTASVSDWPRYQGPRGDCTTPEVAWSKDWPADGPPVLWRAELGKGLASFAVVGRRVFGAGNDGADQDTLWCLDPDTGKVIWQHRFAATTKIHEMPIVPYGPAATPTVVNGRAWFISRDGQVLSLEAETGKVVWQKHLVDDLGGKRPVYGYASSPAVHEGRLYLDNGGSGKSNTCLDAMTGAILWQTGDGEAGYATPFVMPYGEDEVLVQFKGEALELRSAADGKLLARHATETRDFCNCATPVARENLFFISHTGNMGARVVAWEKEGLKEIWTERDLGLLFHSGLPWNGRLLVFNDQVRGANDLRLIDLKTGKMLWQNKEIDKGTGLLTDDGHALLLTNKGELVLAKVSEEKLDILQRVQVLGGKSWVQPVLSGGRLLCKNNEGAVVCLDLASK